MTRALDYATSGTSPTELAILDGATVTTDEVNTLDGITATVIELNYSEGVTSAIQAQLDNKLDSPILSTDLPSLSFTRTEKLDAAVGSTTRMTAPAGYFFWDLSSLTDDNSGQNAGAWVFAIDPAGTWVDVQVNNTYDSRYFAIVWAKFS